ncbi:N-methyl-L-tryptophan oxidase [uncultured Ramlibacter sp.]|uniref:N-methyl-L-tryptophan oxidase n=1 Tax=uncultured Ramlibacter sp. TaxID=260755 RepID=UPI00261114DB|nr:N-methyl-L-tryptophan oxidase [uncultured Ramlibacter sp.]
MAAHAYDAIVVGLGAVGAATLYQAARRGARVLGIDQYQPPHDLGSSHGLTRITRLAVGEGDAYVPLVHRSHQIWRELESATGLDIMTTTAGLILGPRDAVAAHHGKPDFVRRTIACAQRHGIAHEVLDAAGIARRYPQFRLRGDELGYWEPQAGFVRPEAAIEAQLRLAGVLGAQLRTGERVLDLEPHAGGWQVRTDRATHVAAQLVLAAGPWIGQLLRDSLGHAWSASFSVHRQVMHWFDAGAGTPAFAPGKFPVFIWKFGDAQEDYMYGFPAVGPGPLALKVATEQYSLSTTPATLEREVSQVEGLAMHGSRVQGRFDIPRAPPLQSRACMYTVTPDSNFVLDELPQWPGVHLASACSGHGFKHSAAVGEALAERVLGRTPTVDLSAFRHARLAAHAYADKQKEIPSFPSGAVTGTIAPQ